MPMPHQQAIIVTRENIDEIAEGLIDYTAQHILDEVEPMFNRHMVPILVRESVGADYVVSHIISLSMFLANAKPAEGAGALNDENYVRVTQLP